MLTNFTTEQINNLKRTYIKGTRVKLVSSTDKTMRDKIGKTMIVNCVDDIGQLHGSWGVAINLEADTIEIISCKK